MAKRRSEVIANEERCRRNDGKKWRCPFRRFRGKRYCHKHHIANLQRRAKSSEPTSTSKSRVRVSNPSKKKKKPVVRPHKKKKATPVSLPRPVTEEENTEIGGGEGVVKVLELDEIWAFPQESDGFPRSYARIERIIPIQSLVEVTPLVPHLVSNDEMLFAEQGLSMACGNFQASESTVIKEISAFTHRVLFKAEGEENSFYKIFPKKGEVWAIYLNWNNSKKSFEYKLVEILSDFTEEAGVNVAGLVRVEGSDGIYQRQLHEGFQLIRSFSRRFLLMFSHQVPASRMVECGETLWKVMFH